MAYTLSMPEVGETVTEGTIERWLKQPGEKVEKYEPIVEINTDKVNVELPCPVTGTVTEHLVQEGETVPIGTALCTIDEIAGETPADMAPPRPVEQDVPGVPEKEPAAVTASRESEAAAPPVASTGTKPARREGNGRNGGKNRATPRVRKVAAELSVDLAQVSGTGPGGRIVEADVRAFSESGGAATAVAERSAPKAQQAPPVAAGQDDEPVALTGVRKTIAQRMTQSAFTAPVAWLVVECDVTPLVALRQAKKEAFRQRHGADLTYLPFMAHAVSQSLLDHPYLNASWGDDKIILRKRVNLSIAIATERGLMVPVIRDADRMSVTGLALAMDELGEKTRTNRLQLEDVQGGTFTLDNTGSFGSIISKPIINSGQSAIITMEVITKRPAVVGDNAIAIRSLVNVCLSFDHRVLDGHQAGAFLQDVKKRLEAFGPESGID